MIDPFASARIAMVESQVRTADVTDLTVLSALRALPQTMDTPLNLRYRLGLTGHRPYSWPAPDGYPEGEAIWGTVLRPVGSPVRQTGFSKN